MFPLLLSLVHCCLVAMQSKMLLLLRDVLFLSYAKVKFAYIVNEWMLVDKKKSELNYR